MKNPRIIGRLFSSVFLIFGLLLWTWYRVLNDAGPSDGPGVGILLLGIIVLTIYYFILTVWNWGLLMKYSTFSRTHQAEKSVI
jgi:hypothetical protein